jgi:C4-dicarboxylate-specific signal transduction histidine kinase
VLGAAAFVGVWRTTATRGDRADEARATAARKLDHAQTRSAALSTQLDRVKGDLAAALRDKKHLKVELRNAVQQAAAAGQQAANDRTKLATIQHRASTVTSYVASLDAYVKATPSQSLDSSFLGSQLAYLSAAAHRLQAP